MIEIMVPVLPLGGTKAAVIYRYVYILHMELGAVTHFKQAGIHTLFAKKNIFEAKKQLC